MTTESVVVRKALGRRLRSLRVAAGKTQADLAPIASVAKIKRIENGSAAQKLADVRALCFVYGVDAETTEHLVAMTLNRGQGWWEDYHDVIPPWFLMVVELESAADRVINYDGELVYGLLQTPAYHRAVVEQFGRLTVEEAERHIRMRAQRQSNALERAPPLQVSAIIGEGVIRREVGGREVMREQLDHLTEIARQPHVDLHVLPFRAGAHAGMRGAFTVLGFDRPDDPDVVYLETHAGGRYMESPALTTEYRRKFAAISAKSLPLEEYLR